MPQILDGKKARDFYKARLIERLSKLSSKPLLALVQIGDNKESAVYIEQKKKFAASIGALVEHIHLAETVTQLEVRKHISSLNSRLDVHGIIIQLPIPAHLDKQILIELIDPKKDVDGLTDTNQKLLASGTPQFIPATAKGVGLLMDFYNINPKGKLVTVFGRSRLVGFPTAELLKQKGADVSVCHSQTVNPQEISQKSDILIVAIGKPKLIDASYIKPGAVVIDVGISSVSGHLVGDVNFAAVSPLVSAISPVPGGVGPMTVLSLFDNLILSAEMAHERGSRKN